MGGPLEGGEHDSPIFRMTKFHASAKGVVKSKKSFKFKFPKPKPFEFNGSDFSPSLFGGGGVKKQVKEKWGTKALREIRRAQKETHQVIAKAPLERTVRDIASDFLKDKDWRFEDSAFRAVQEAAEAFGIGSLEDANLAGIHAGRVTLMAKDLRLAQRLKGEFTSDGMGGYK